MASGKPGAVQSCNGGGYKKFTRRRLTTHLLYFTILLFYSGGKTTTSPNNTYVWQGSVTTDAAGSTWEIANGQAVVNGQVDQSNSRIQSLACQNGKVWQINRLRKRQVQYH
jgi:hypothetical protein